MILKARDFLYRLFTVLIVAAVISGCFTPVVYASQVTEKADSDYVYVLYNSQNGLPTSEANDIIQTGDGLIWIASYGGLTRYDGKDYERISAEDGVSSANTLMTDNEGNLWIGTNDSGIAIYTEGAFSHFTESDGLASNTVKDMVEVDDNDIYAGTTAGLDLIKRDTMAVTTFNDSVLGSSSIVSLDKADDDSVICVTNDGNVFRIKNGIVTEDSEIKKVWDGAVVCAYVDKYGTEYYGTEENKVIKKTADGDRFVYTIVDCGTLKYINALYLNSSEELWICADNGIGYFGTGGNNLQVLENVAMNSSVDSVIEDYEGNMWFSSSRQGIMKRTENYFTDISKRVGFDERVVNSVVNYNGTMYVATDTGLLAYNSDYTAVENELTEFIADARVRNLMIDSDNNLWLCTYAQSGLVKFNGRKISCLTDKDGILSERVRSAIQLSNGDIYVATSMGINIIRNSAVVGSIEKEDGLTNPTVLSMVQDENGTVYAGTDGGGVFVIENEKVVKSITQKDGLQSDIVMRVVCDKDNGGYWFVTNSVIAFYDGETVKNIKKFPYSNNFDIYFQGDTLWILSGAGIFSTTSESMLSDEPLVYSHYTYETGMPSVPTANSFSMKTEDNILYVCGSSGIYSLDLNRMQESGADSKIAISSVILDGERKWVTGKDNVEIDKTIKRIRIDALAVNNNLADPLVEYYLEGFDEQPIRTLNSDLGDIVYTNLAGGTYTFHFSIIDPKTEEVISSKTLKIKKETDFFATSYFYVLIVGGIIFVIAIIAIQIIRQRMNKRMLAKIQGALKQAEDATNAKTMFLSNMSHDMRTPMNAILGMSDLGMDAQEISEMKEYMSNINTAGKQLLSLINDTLDVSRIENGKMELQPENISSKELAASITSSIKINAEQKGVTFCVNDDKAKNVMLYVDVVKIQKVMVNILSNAVKFTAAGGRVDMIIEDTNCTDESSCYRITITDTGCGMSEEFLEHIFEPFMQESRTTAVNRTGTGLGMTIVKNIVEFMGGSIDVHSKINEGTTFTVYLNLPHSKNQDMPVAKQVTTSGRDTNGKRILVCEDHPMNQIIIKKLLEKRGYTVDIAANGREGVEAYEKSEDGYYSLIFMDIRMPEIDGLQATRIIRASDKPDARTIPVVAMTANAFEQDVEASLQAGMNAHLSKPIDVSVLDETLNKLI